MNTEEYEKDLSRQIKKVKPAMTLVEMPVKIVRITTLVFIVSLRICASTKYTHK